MDDIKTGNYIYSGTSLLGTNGYYKSIDIGNINQYLCFYAHEDSVITITKQSISDNSDYYYVKESTILNHNNQGYDNQVNNRITDYSAGDMANHFRLSDSPINIELTHGDRLYLWIDSTNTNVNNYNSIRITGTGKYSVSGNILSLFNKMLTIKYIEFSYLFYGNTALYDASGLILPSLGLSTSLPGNCYQGMFSNCTQLRYPPKLPEAYIDNTDYCYDSMFSGCSNLIVAPDISIVFNEQISHEDTCCSMFYGCTSLIQSPELNFNVSDRDNGTFRSMFWGCTNLILGPSEIRCSCENGCSSMFRNCTSLIKAPKLPNTNLSPDCYESMFYGCTSLEEAPVLPALEINDSCYDNMFNGCTKLKKIEAYFLTNLFEDTAVTTGWVDGVASEGVILLNPENDWFINQDNHRGVNEIPTGWYVSDMNYDYSPYDDMYLTFESLEDGNTFTYQFPVAIEYSIDNGGTWISLPLNTASPVRNKGQKIMWRGNNTNQYSIGCFTSTKKFNAYGNIMSLRFSDDFHSHNHKTCNYAYEHYSNISTAYTEQGLFYNCTNLISAKNLRLLYKIPSYSGNHQGNTGSMFYGCTNLIDGPELIYPIIDTSDAGGYPIYSYMFYNCTSLKRLNIYVIHENGNYNSTFPTMTNIYIWDSPLNNYYFKGERINGSRTFINNKETFHKDLKVINRNYISVHGTQSNTVSYTQFIDLNYVPTANTGISITAKCDNTNDKYLIACRNGTTTHTRFGIGHSQGYYYGWGGYMSGNQTSTYNTNDWRNIKLNYLNDGYFSINSEDEQTTYYSRLISDTTGTYNGVTYPLNFTPSYTLVLFGQRTSNTVVTYVWTGSIKSVQITEGENIVMDLIPISIYGAAGFYDKIGKKYYGQYFFNHQSSYNLSDSILEYH